MIIIYIVVLITVSSVSASTKCISQPAIKKYEELRGPLQDIENYLNKCHGSYTSKEPITSLRQSIKKIEKQIAAVNKIFYGKSVSFYCFVKTKILEAFIDLKTAHLVHICKCIYKCHFLYIRQFSRNKNEYNRTPYIRYLFSAYLYHLCQLNCHIIGVWLNISIHVCCFLKRENGLMNSNIMDIAIFFLKTNCHGKKPRFVMTIPT